MRLVTLAESADRLNESSLNVILDILGFIPGIGEAADFTNVIIFLKRAKTSDNPKVEYLFAALSLVSMIPEVGDIVGKGGKLLVRAAKNGRLARSPLLLKTQRAIIEAGPEIDRIMTAISQKANDFKPYAKAMKEALHEFAQKQPQSS